MTLFGSAQNNFYVVSNIFSMIDSASFILLFVSLKQFRINNNNNNNSNPMMLTSI